MRLIDSSSLVVMFSSEAERPTMTATSASCAVKDGGVSEAMAFEASSWGGSGPLVLTKPAGRQ